VHGDTPAQQGGQASRTSHQKTESLLLKKSRLFLWTLAAKTVYAS